MSPFINIKRLLIGLLGAILFPAAVVSNLATGVGLDIYHARKLLGPYDIEIISAASGAYRDGGISAFLYSLIPDLAVAGFLLAIVASCIVTLFLTIFAPEKTAKQRIVQAFILVWLLIYLASFSSSSYGNLCTQAFTPGRNILTNECVTFSNGCLSLGYTYDNACYTEDYLKALYEN